MSQSVSQAAAQSPSSSNTVLLIAASVLIAGISAVAGRAEEPPAAPAAVAPKQPAFTLPFEDVTIRVRPPQGYLAVDGKLKEFLAKSGTVFQTNSEMPFICVRADELSGWPPSGENKPGKRSTADVSYDSRVRHATTTPEEFAGFVKMVEARMLTTLHEVNADRAASDTRINAMSPGMQISSAEASLHSLGVYAKGSHFYTFGFVTRNVKVATETAKYTETSIGLSSQLLIHGKVISLTITQPLRVGSDVVASKALMADWVKATLTANEEPYDGASVALSEK